MLKQSKRLTKLIACLSIGVPFTFIAAFWGTPNQAANPGLGTPNQAVASVHTLSQTRPCPQLGLTYLRSSVTTPEQAQNLLRAFQYNTFFSAVYNRDIRHWVASPSEAEGLSQRAYLNPIYYPSGCTLPAVARTGGHRTIQAAFSSFLGNFSPPISHNRATDVGFGFWLSYNGETQTDYLTTNWTSGINQDNYPCHVYNNLWCHFERTTLRHAPEQLRQEIKSSLANETGFYVY